MMVLPPKLEGRISKRDLRCGSAGDGIEAYLGVLPSFELSLDSSWRQLSLPPG